MYEVRWEFCKGCGETVDTFDNQIDAMKLYEDIKYDAFVESIGLYYTDGDGNEKELATWSR